MFSNNRLTKKLKAGFPAVFGNCGGFTLVEVIVSLLIVSLLALMILSANGVVFSLVVRGADTGVNANAVYTEIEQNIAAGTGGVSGTVSFTAEGAHYAVSGAFYQETSIGDQSPEIGMEAFVPGAGAGGGQGERES